VVASYCLPLTQALAYEEGTSMGLFAVEYQDVPGRGVIAQGGLKFRASEEALSRYFAPILPYVSLNELIGEAVFWITIPSAITIWAFPLFLYLYGLPLGLLLALGLHVIAEVIHQIVYIKLLNYLSFFGNRMVQIMAYIILGIVFGFTGHGTWTIALAGVLTFYAVGLSEVLMSVVDIFLAKFVGIPKSDQLLRLIGWHYGRKYTNDDPTEWTMFDDGNAGRPPKDINRASERKITSYMPWSILLTMFWFTPLGIASIYYSSKVMTYRKSGNYLEAEKASKNARKCCWFGFVGGLIFAGVGLLFIYFSSRE
jgi:hypothetical protein